LFGRPGPCSEIQKRSATAAVPQTSSSSLPSITSGRDALSTMSARV
jgi:hypothetical protein